MITLFYNISSWVYIVLPVIAMIAVIISMTKFKGRIDKLSIVAFIFLGLSVVFLVLKEVINLLNVFLFLEPILFILMLCCFFAYIIILATKVYREKLRKNPNTKKIFWIYTAVMTALIMFIAFVVIFR